MTKLAACLIVKATDDEAVHLERCLENVHKHVDGIFLNLNHKAGQKASEKVMEVAKRYTANIIDTEWNDDFAEARNANLAQVPKEFDWIIWLDSDDTVDHPEKIKEVAEASGNFDAIYVDYLYDRDEENNPMTVHMVARLFKHNDSHKWKGMIHETLVEQRSASQGMTKDFMIIHHAESERTERSFKRNIKLLEKQLDSETKDPDPRTFYYLASTYMDAGYLEQAKQLFSDYISLSGWDQERCVAETKLGRIYLQEGDRTEAKKHFLLAVGEDPDSPDPRVELGSLEIEMKQYRKAQSWLEYVLKMDINQTTLERNPMAYTFRTYLLLADVYFGMGGKWLKQAAQFAKKARRYKKKDPKVVEYTKMIEQIYQDKLELEAIMTRFKKFKDKGQRRKAQLVLDSIPERLADNPIVARLRQENKPFKWPRNTIAIMTGDTVIDEWGPWSLKEGIGGSEEAIIRLAPKLQAIGYKVVVFAKPGAHTGLDKESGVMWRNYWDCNLEDEFDIFIAWRAPFIFEKNIKARKKYLWMHDVMEPGEFGENRIKNFDKCILLSDYHRSLFPMIPDEKVLMSGNGIDPEDFTALDNSLLRIPTKVFYGSSHVRGLAYLYEIWPEVKTAVPEATLDVYYGRESYDAVHRGNPERAKWMDDMMAKAKKLDGVIDHGKVSQEQINRAIFRSGVWAYPCVTGDTLVDMPRDYQKYPLGVPIRKLVGKKNFPVWSYNERTGKFELKNVNWVAKTREKAEIIKINWTDGTSLRCTPDHKVYTYKRGWVAAKDLEINESAVALKKHMMVQVSAGQGKWPYEHRMIAEYSLGNIPKGYHVDHIDGNCFNNEPSNLQILSPSDHAAKTHKEQFSTQPLIERRETRWNHKVESIETAGVEDVYDMNVDSNHNFIAGGVVVHNCPFPEIYCITAIKAQAGGAVPVASNYAALNETIQFGHKQKLGEFNDEDLQKYKEALIWWLQHPEEQEKVRPKMIQWARNKSWKAVAEEWHKDFQAKN